MRRWTVFGSTIVVIATATVLAACSSGEAATPTMNASLEPQRTAALTPTLAVATPPIQATEAKPTPIATATRVSTDTATPLSPTPTLGPLGHVLEFTMTSNRVGWLLNDARHVWLTSDGAKTWTDVTPDIGEHVVEAVTFLTDERAWISTFSPTEIGQDPSAFLIWYTENAGKTWSRGRTPKLGGEHAAGLLYFVDDQHGFYQVSSGVGAGSCGYFLLATKDGGATWESRSAQDVLQGQATTAQPLSACSHGFGFLSDMVGWAAGDAYNEYFTYFYRTHDGGLTWEQQALGNSPEATTGAVCQNECITFPPAFSDKTHGVLATQGSVAGGVSLWTTQDGGESWQLTVQPSEYARVVRRPQFWAGNQGWTVLARNSGKQDIWVTSDQGLTWGRAGRDLLEGSLVSVDPSGVFWLAYQGGISLSTDGGSTWEPIGAAQ